MAAETERELTHEELWDDSALVASWDEALEEYQKYHSMAARGEKVPVVTTQPKKPELPSKAAAMLNGTKPPPQSQTQPEPPASKPIPGNFKGPAPIGPAPQEAPAVAMPSSLATMPTALLAATSQDENLRNMMMSWYYAGYHTGLYEGQQKVLAQWQESLQVEEGAGEVEG